MQPPRADPSGRPQLPVQLAHGLPAVAPPAAPRSAVPPHPAAARPAARPAAAARHVDRGRGHRSAAAVASATAGPFTSAGGGPQEHTGAAVGKLEPRCQTFVGLAAVIAT